VFTLGIEARMAEVEILDVLRPLPVNPLDPDRLNDDTELLCSSEGRGVDSLSSEEL